MNCIGQIKICRIWGNLRSENDIILPHGWLARLGCVAAERSVVYMRNILCHKAAMESEFAVESCVPGTTSIKKLWDASVGEELPCEWQ